MTHNPFLKLSGVQYPVICGAMYPCSNPELVAAVSEAGGIGIIQPLTLTYVCGYSIEEGLRFLKSLTSKPVGMNLLLEGSSKTYRARMEAYLDAALRHGIRFFVTALGNPSWVVERVHKESGVVFHDVTALKWAQKALDAGVDGFICVNHLAGGHAGHLSPEKLVEDLQALGKPLVAAGGVGDRKQFQKMLTLGYHAVQMGTRFIATEECHASDAYKKAILEAEPSQVVLTERLTGVPVSVLLTEKVKRLGLTAGPIAKFLLQNKKTKHWMRLFYSLKSFRDLKKSIKKENLYDDYWQAGKSVQGIHAIEKAAQIVEEFGKV